MVLYPLCCASDTALMVSVSVPIWFTFTSRPLAMPLSIPVCKRFTLVTNRSSPTSWHLLPTAWVRAFQPFQSSSAIPSSIEAIGYCFTHFSQNFTSSSLLTALPLLLWNTYFFFLASHNSLLAASIAITICEPVLYPAAEIASSTVSMASSLLWILGAKPPSSPTLVLNPFFFNTLFSTWKISTPQRRPSLKEGAPTGMIMNSWKSILLSACAPPLRMFIIGIGSVLALVPPM